MAEDVCADVVDELLERVQSEASGALVRGRDEVLNLGLMLGEEGGNIATVNERCALRLARQQQPDVETEAGPCVKGQPGDDVEVRFD